MNTCFNDMGRKGILIILIFSSLSYGRELTNDRKEMRAIWVTRWDYKSRADVEKIIKNASDYNFNTVLFQVRGNGTVAFRSNYEPWMEELGGKEPDWDPLKTAIDFAHQNSLQLHAWVNVYVGWTGTSVPKHPLQLYNRHKDWFVKDMEGNNQPMPDLHYHWLSPTHPEVKHYLINLFTDLLKNYDIDGLHFDYFRYAGSGYSYDQASLEQFRQIFAGTPQEMPAKWDSWRRQAITDVLQALYERVRDNKPELIVSAAVVGDYYLGRNVFLQDCHLWMAAGIIDAIFPMIYTDDNDRFRDLLFDHLVNDHGRYVFAGVRTINAASILNQVKMSREMGGRGVALFTYSDLFPNHKANKMADTLKTNLWQEKVQIPTMQWKKEVFDKQGPVITDLRTLPAVVHENESFKVLCRINDQSGIYEGVDGVEDQGVYLIYDYEPLTGKGTRVKMIKVDNSEDWYITNKEIEPQPARADFDIRIFAYDDYYESAGHPKRNSGYSDIQNSLIHKPVSVYKSIGEWGPLIFNPTSIAVDSAGRVWIASSNGRHLRVIRPDGLEEDFSPIENAVDSRGIGVTLPILAGLAISPEGIVYLSTSNEKNQHDIYRFNLEGKPLRAWDLGFAAGELDFDGTGHLFVLEAGTTTWHVFDKAGMELLNSPFGARHSGLSLAVSPNAGVVYVTNRSVGVIHRWNGAVESGIARYWQVDDLDASRVGIGRVATDNNGNIFVPQTNRGVVSFMNPAGAVQEYITGGKASLKVPSAIGISPDGSILYVVETAGLSSLRLHKWVRTR